MNRTSRTYRVSVTREIAAPAARVYAVFADYREAHPRILPPRFFSGLEVEDGGDGAGTRLIVQMKFAGRVRAMRGTVTEPEPGRRLVEAYPEDRTETSFLVDAGSVADACVVTISTTLPVRPSVLGWIERHVVRYLLRRVYAEELERVAAYVTQGAERIGGSASGGTSRAPWPVT